MDDPYLPPPAGQDPLALASVACGIGGIAVYCCGSLLCIGWLAFPVWMVGVVLGLIGASRTTGNQRVIALVGVAANILPAVALGLLVIFGVGLSVLGNLANQ